MADRTGFNLIREPWIAALDADGRAIEVSLQELFAGAATVRAISGETVTQDFALLRLALAILTRALDEFGPTEVQEVPEKIAEIAAMWDSEAVPAVTRYLEQHRERFDLFHSTTPFYQVPGMRTAKGEVSEVSKIIADMPAGKPYLTVRSAKATAVLSPAEAARWLVHVHAYDTSGIKTGVVGHPRARGGKVYPEGVAWAGQLGGLYLVGDSLMHTLLLNLWAVLPTWERRALDLPPWERPQATLEAAPDLASRPSGPVDLFTWQPRRVTLIGGRDGVTGVLVTYGDSFTIQERQFVVREEPMSLWRYSEPQSKKYKTPIQMPSLHQPGVALWRGIAAVVPDRQRQRSDQERAVTELVEHAARIARSSLVEHGLVRYRAIGVVYGAQNSVIDEIVEDSLDLPAAMLDPDATELRRVARDGVNAAKDGVAALTKFARELARAAGAGAEEAQGHGDRAYETAFAALDAPYRDWLRNTLAIAEDRPLWAEAEWHTTARWILSALGDSWVSRVPDKAWLGFGAAGRRDDVGVIHLRFRRDLGRAFPRAGSRSDIEPAPVSDNGAGGSPDNEEDDK